MSIYHRRFTTGEIAKATSVTNTTLQTWFKRGLIVGNREIEDREIAPIEGGGSPGRHRAFSVFNAMEIAVAKELVDVGLDLPNAFSAAMHFAHTGQGALPGIPGREPSFPFDLRTTQRLTMLCVRGGASVTLPWHPKDQEFYVTARHRLGGVTGMIVLEINPIFERVIEGLGYDPDRIMKDAYQADQLA